MNANEQTADKNIEVLDKEYRDDGSERMIFEIIKGMGHDGMPNVVYSDYADQIVFDVDITPEKIVCENHISVYLREDNIQVGEHIYKEEDDWNWIVLHIGQI